MRRNLRGEAIMRNYVACLDFVAACRRLDRYVADLAEAKGIEVHAIVGADSPMFANGPDVYKIHLRNDASETSLLVDHEMLTDSDEFFLTFVVPQLEDAVDKLRAEHIGNLVTVTARASEQ